MSTNLHIERLILDGLSVSHAQGENIATALERELARLLTTGGLGANLQAGGAWPNMPVSELQLTTSKPSQIGQQIAQAVYQEIGREHLATSRNPYANKNQR